MRDIKHKLHETPDEPNEVFDVGFDDDEAITFLTMGDAVFWAKTQDFYHGHITELFDEAIYSHGEDIVGGADALEEMIEETDHLFYKGDLQSAYARFSKVGEDRDTELFGRVWPESNLFSVWDEDDDRVVLKNLKKLYKTLKIIGIKKPEKLVWDFSSEYHNDEVVHSKFKKKIGILTLGDVLKSNSGTNTGNTPKPKRKPKNNRLSNKQKTELKNRLKELFALLHVKSGNEKTAIKNQILNIRKMLGGKSADLDVEMLPPKKGWNSMDLAGSGLSVAEGKLTESPDSVYLNGERYSYTNDDTIAYLTDKSGFVLYSNLGSGDGHYVLRNAIYRIRDRFRANQPVDKEFLESLDCNAFPKIPTQESEIDDMQIHGRLFTDIKVLTFWANDLKDAVGNLKISLPFLKFILKDDLKNYKLDDWYSNPGKFISIPQLVQNANSIKSASPEQKARNELLKQYHTETSPIRKKVLAQQLGMLQPKPLKFGMSQWQADQARNIAERKLTETPDWPRIPNGPESAFETDAITFFATTDCIVWGPTDKYVYHGTLSDALDKTVDQLREDYGAEWYKEVDDMTDTFFDIIKQWRKVSENIHVTGRLKAEYFLKSGTINKFGHLEKSGRGIGLLKGRLWPDDGIVSFWDDDTAVKKYIHFVFPLFKEFNMHIPDIRVDLQSYMKDMYKDGFKVETISSLVGKEVKQVPNDLKKLLNQLKAQLHSEPSKAEEIRRKIKQLVVSYSKTQDVDAVVDTILGRMMGSEVEMDRAKKAGYDNVAAMKGARPVREHSAYMDLMEDVYRVSEKKQSLSEGILFGIDMPKYRNVNLKDFVSDNKLL